MSHVNEGAMTATPTVESLLAQWVEAFNSDLDKHMELYT